MPVVRLHQIIRETNFSLETIVDFLRMHGFDIEMNPNSCVPEEAKELCLKHFSTRKEAVKYTKEGFKTLTDLARTLGFVLDSMACPDNDLDIWIEKWNEEDKTIANDAFADYSNYIIDSFSFFTSCYHGIFDDAVPILERWNYLDRLRVLSLLYSELSNIAIPPPYPDKITFKERVSRLIELKRQWIDCSKHKFNTSLDKRLFASFDKICEMYSKCLVYMYSNI